MRVLILIVVCAAKVIKVTGGILLLGQSPSKAHHWNQALVTKDHFSFVAYGVSKKSEEYKGAESKGDPRNLV